MSSRGSKFRKGILDASFRASLLSIRQQSAIQVARPRKNM